MARLAAFLLVLLLGGAAAAQDADRPNGVLLVAKPGLSDPRFRETVVLVTQAPDGQTVGVILNRPLGRKLADFWPGSAGAEREVYYGGPVMERAIVALLRSPTKPDAPAFRVLRDVYLSMHPRAIEPLLADSGRAFRLYAGFSGWVQGQLRSELERDDWHVLPANADIVLREDTSRLWQELIDRARGIRTRAGAGARAILVP